LRKKTILQKKKERKGKQVVEREVNRRTKRQSFSGPATGAGSTFETSLRPLSFPVGGGKKKERGCLGARAFQGKGKPPPGTGTNWVEYQRRRRKKAFFVSTGERTGGQKRGGRKCLLRSNRPTRSIVFEVEGKTDGGEECGAHAGGAWTGGPVLARPGRKQFLLTTGKEREEDRCRD